MVSTRSNEKSHGYAWVNVSIRMMSYWLVIYLFNFLYIACFTRCKYRIRCCSARAYYIIIRRENIIISYTMTRRIRLVTWLSGTTCVIIMVICDEYLPRTRVHIRVRMYCLCGWKRSKTGTTYGQRNSGLKNASKISPVAFFICFFFSFFRGPLDRWQISAQGGKLCALLLSKRSWISRTRFLDDEPATDAVIFVARFTSVYTFRIQRRFKIWKPVWV